LYTGADPGFYVRGGAHFLARGLGKAPLKLLGIRKYRTSFLNPN